MYAPHTTFSCTTPHALHVLSIEVTEAIAFQQVTQADELVDADTIDTAVESAKGLQVRWLL